MLQYGFSEKRRTYVTKVNDIEGALSSLWLANWHKEWMVSSCQRHLWNECGFLSKAKRRKKGRNDHGDPSSLNTAQMAVRVEQCEIFLSCE